MKRNHISLKKYNLRDILKRFLENFLFIKILKLSEIKKITNKNNCRIYVYYCYFYLLFVFIAYFLILAISI